MSGRPPAMSCPPSAFVCSAHGSPLIIFCNYCKEVLCEGCLSSDEHRGHGFDRLRDASKNQLEEVIKRAQKLTSKLKKTSDIFSQVSKTKKDFEEKFKQATERVNKLYCDLLDLILKNQQQALSLIQGQKENRVLGLERLAQEAEQFNQRIALINGAVAQLKERVECNNADTLLEINALHSSIETIDDFYRMLEEKMYLDNTRLEALVAENLTFDEKTAHSTLLTSDDRTQVRYFNQIPSKREETFANILAAQSFTDGCHYWDVEVKGAECWTVGVVAQGWLRKGSKQAPGEDGQSWALQLDGGTLVALHNGDGSIVRESGFERLGIFLDYDKGLLQFYNVDTGQSLCIFYTKFKHAVFPAFSISHEEGKVPQLVLCDLVPQSQGTQLSHQAEFSI